MTFVDQGPGLNVSEEMRQEYEDDSATYQELWTKFLLERTKDLPSNEYDSVTSGSELAMTFLLKVTDNGREWFADAVRNNLVAGRVEVAEMVESGNIDGAVDLANLTRALADRQKRMFTQNPNSEKSFIGQRLISEPVGIQ